MHVDTPKGAIADSKAHISAPSKINPTKIDTGAPPITSLHRSVPEDQIVGDGGSEADKAVMERLEVIIAANRDLLNLTDEERSRLIADVAFFQELRREIEKTLISYDGFDGTSHRIQIRAYPEIGAALKQQFDTKLKQDFPFGRSTVIDKHLGSFLMTEFKYFGQLSQTFHVSTSRDQGNIVLMWETNREAGADPYKVPEVMTGTAILSDQTFSDGEFAGIAKLLKEHLRKRP